MATSGTQTFKLDASDLIEEAYERCGLELRTGYDAKTARRSLNILMSDWSNRGINLWTVNEATQSLTAGTANYSLDAYTVDVLDAVIRRDGVDYNMERIGRSEYQNLPKKTTEGRPTQYWVDRQSTPVIYLYPTPENSTDQLRFYRTERVEDVNALTNDVDVPSRFIAPLVSGLAYHLAVKKAPERAQGLKMIYEEEMARAEAEDRERVSMRIVPSRGYL
jgi:hypothetical protein